MRIAIFGGRGIPSTYSGTETFFIELAPRLVERGHDVIVYCRKALFKEQPSVGNDAFGQWQRSSHQESRPIDAMEAHDLFADHVNIGWPIPCKLFLLFFIRRAEADRRAVIREGVEPHVDDMIGVVGDGHAPFEGATADGKVAQATAHESHYFIASRFRTNKSRILLVVLQQLVGKFRKLEEVIFFLDSLRRAATLWAGCSRSG